MISVTSTANGVNVDFNGYFADGKIDTKNGYWAKGAVQRVLNHGTYIEIKSLGDSWLLNTDGTQDLLGVATVDAVVPTDIDHLYSLLIGALA